MKVQIISGVMIKGTAVFPKTGEGKNAQDSIVEVSTAEARTMIYAGQAKAAPKDAKVNVEIKDPEDESNALDDFFGDDEGDDE
ncbi:hypothetical protein [Vibrio cyclitrophicus]|uniref:Uncharacterized protein n=1 Tax=Vibrio sp. 1F_97 TaxID=1652827 RepID=A0A0H3ZUV4_9VIBR|nr:hypothetical protein [Vibrio cyclitrophicus]AKN37326.1 hypothetical protein [Vibrio sp. 1F_97]OEF28072.1 hypothetical protein OA9_00905 [Vibrio cyclitrophicus 1F97]